MEYTSVKKATRLEYAPPKNKHLLALKNMTLDNPACIDVILASLEKRLNERSWIVTFKVLAVLHFIMREGNCVRAVDGIIKRRSVLDTSKIKNKDSTPANVKNIYMYRAYLDERVVAYRHLRRDYIHELVKNKEGGRLRHLSLTDGLLRELAALQRQLHSALECKFFFKEKDPQITLFVYKMVLKDIIAVYQSINDGIVNMLEHYFKMTKTDAMQALSIYDKFTQQTELTIGYLIAARNMQDDLEMVIPHIEHAPLTLRNSLEKHLNNKEDNVSASTLQPLSLPIKNTENIASSPSPLQQKEDYFTQINAPMDRKLSLETHRSMSSGYISPVTPRSINSSNPFLNQGLFLHSQPTPIVVVDTNPFRSLSINSDSSGAIYNMPMKSPMYDTVALNTPPISSTAPLIFTNPFMQSNISQNHHRM